MERVIIFFIPAVRPLSVYVLSMGFGEKKDWKSHFQLLIGDCHSLFMPLLQKQAVAAQVSEVGELHDILSA
jgi:hypothetical protein